MLKSIPETAPVTMPVLPNVDSAPINVSSRTLISTLLRIFLSSRGNKYTWMYSLRDGD